jgi:hypothetical protein
LPVNVATGAAIGSVLRAGEATLEVAEDLRKVERQPSKERRRRIVRRRLSRSRRCQQREGPTC